MEEIKYIALKMIVNVINAMKFWMKFSNVKNVPSCVAQNVSTINLFNDNNNDCPINRY